MKSETHMSNLKLPTLTHANLHELLGKRPEVKLAYATYARRVHGSRTIEVIHHTSAIATLEADGTIYLDTNGYDSQTTANRLNAIVVDSGTPWKVGIRQRETCLLDSEGRKVRELSTATIGKSGALLEVNGHRIGGSL